MRTEIVHPGADKLRYEIRRIVAVAESIGKLGMPIVWENIGDPVAKGEQVPAWIRETVKTALDDNASFGYSPTLGLADTRRYIADERNAEGGVSIEPEDILFFNGLGDAISTLYSNLHPNARVIGPNPAYPTHSSAEAAHADSVHITYRLDPENGWEPDLVDLETKIEANPDIAGILIINPDNPTGFVYPEETLRTMVALAKKHGLFLISDEIYSNLAFEGSGMCKLASVIGDVPGIAMRGISKEFPWPGARCGWIEFYNRGTDESFDRFAASLQNAKMLEVCSTTLPQTVLPRVMGDARYYPYLSERVAAYEWKSRRAVEILSTSPGLIIHPAKGAFYMTAVFKEGALTAFQTLPVSDEARTIIEPYLADANFDQRFVYYLLAATGICLVPLSLGFNSDRDGFRFTLLDADDASFERTMETIRSSLELYLAS